jgi:hypothetical protein
MIIQNRIAPISYGTDPTAAGVRAFVSRGARFEPAARRAVTPAASADLARLYPNLCGTESAPRRAARLIAVATAGVSAAGSIAAALVAILHR